MPADIFLDTNVLVYAILSNHARSPIANRLISIGGRISVQVMNELVNVARRKHRLPWDRIEQISRDLL